MPMKFWFKNDNNFRDPHAAVYVGIYFKAACDDARSCAFSELFILFLKDELSEVMYEANIALIKMLISFIDGISFLPTKDRYELMKEEAMAKNLMNEDTSPLNIILCKHNYDSNEKRPHLDALLFDDFKKFINELRSQKGLCYGNFTKKEAADISEMIMKAFPGDLLLVTSRHVEQVICLPPNEDSLLAFSASRENDMSVAGVYFQFEQHLELTSSNLLALFDLFYDTVKELFFDKLRA
ncbi:hypothetical protein OROHE_014867 [Orobanche hederae]